MLVIEHLCELSCCVGYSVLAALLALYYLLSLSALLRTAHTPHLRLTSLNEVRVRSVRADRYSEEQVASERSKKFEKRGGGEERREARNERRRTTKRNTTHYFPTHIIRIGELYPIPKTHAQLLFALRPLAIPVRDRHTL